MSNREVMQQALEALENMCDAQSNPDRRSFPTTHDFGKSRLACIAIKEALEQQAEPSQWRDMVVVSLVREGIDKHKARELADHFAAQQQAEPVAYFDFQELKFTWAKHMKIGPVPVSIKVEPMKLYSEAPQRPWQGLTDEEITELDMEISGRTMDECVRAIEDKLKEKNDR